MYSMVRLHKYVVFLSHYVGHTGNKLGLMTSPLTYMWDVVCTQYWTTAFGVTVDCTGFSLRTRKKTDRLLLQHARSAYTCI